MVGVVNEAGGTGGNASLADRAVVIAGKTGTSQVRTSAQGRDDAGEDPFEHRDHALFVSYFPAMAPRYAVAAVVEHGGGGGVAAAPIVRDVIAMLLEADPAARASWDGGTSR
jgi:penicillin-binding protein 2